jgi:hypothetical protein
LDDTLLPLRGNGHAMQNDAFTLNALSQLNDVETEITYIERQFLKTLEGVVQRQLDLSNL